MGAIRSRLAVVALALLAWQVAGVCVAPIAIYSVTAAPGAHEDVVCTCDHTSSGICPMHKTAKQRGDPPSHRTRWCAGCGDQADLMIKALLTGSGNLPEARRLIRPAGLSERLFLTTVAPPDAVHSAASPPPRR